MSGKLVALAIIIGTLGIAGGIYYAQVHGYYQEMRDITVELTTPAGDRVTIATKDARAIDGDSSPLNYRACFTSEVPLADLAERFERVQDAVPLNAPGWFDCFDAVAIGNALDAGVAQAYLAQRNSAHGVDRVVAIFPDGRGYAWTQLNGTLE